MSVPQELLQRALQLAPEDRIELADRLYLSMEPDGGEWDPDFLAEIEDRVARYESGATVARDAWEALEELRRKYSDPPPGKPT